VGGFAHAALVYDGPEQFADAVLPFLAEGIEAGEPALVAVGAGHIEPLRDALGEADVTFVDMAELGRNPGRIIPAWAGFIGDHPDTPVRGVGEPIWAGRSSAELVECQLHESLLNLAFAEADGFRLLCPYDRTALDDAVLHEAGCGHPSLVEHGAWNDSPAYRDSDRLLAPFDAPLPRPRGATEAFSFDRDSLDELRALVRHRGLRAGLSERRAQDFVLAVNEAATNSVCHAGGQGVLRVWIEDDALLCEVRDPGVVEDPLAGRRAPSFDRVGGLGLYIAHQLCDLVQLRSGPLGTVVRLHMSARPLSESAA
jgi:anti-sigma regulatory factor (Ser/Thr protein kinase)